MKEKFIDPEQPLTDDERKLLALVDENRQELVDLLQQLVRIDSRNYSEFDFNDRNEIVSFVEQYLKGYDFEVAKYDAPFLGNDPSRYYSNVIVQHAGTKPGRTLQFCGHLDIVPFDEEKWDPNTPPLGGVIQNGRLYGRGAGDMKSGVACQILAMRLLKESAIPFRGKLQLWLTPDEETHGAYGSAYMARHHFQLVNADATLIAEASAMDPLKTPAFGTGEKGATWLKLIFYGASGHGSRPKHKSNPINKATRFINNAKKIKFPEVRPPVTKLDLFKALFSRYRISDMFKLINGYKQARDPYDEDGAPLKEFFQTTCSFGKINSGSAVNVIPDRCTLEIDFRTMPGVSTEALLKCIMEYSSKLGYRMQLPDGYENPQINDRKVSVRPVDIDVSVITRGEGSFDQRESEFGMLFERAFEAVYRVRAIHMLAFGFTDAGNMRAAGIKNIFVMGPKGGGFHAANEYVELDSMVNVAKAYLLTAYRYLNA
jgi:acetylornithine deacetylase/succinyl-diaminopimelate desuccinylase-like protein